MESLKVNHIYKKFGNKSVLNDVSFTLNNGEFGCLLGSSGSGKSTLLRLIAGLEIPDNGEIYSNEKLVSGKNCFVLPEKRNIGLIFQDYALFPHMTVKQNIEFGLKKGDSKQMMNEAIRILGIENLLGRYQHEISGGQQQRVAIARSMAVSPNLLLMDEPFSNLDEWSKEEVRDELKSLLRQLNATVLFVTHHAGDAISFSDKIMVLHNGKISQQGSTKEIIDSPINAEVAGIFGKVNLFSSDEINQLFSLRMSSNSYFIRPGDFEISAGNEFKITSVTYQGEYFDVDAVKNNKKIHLHLRQLIKVGDTVNVFPLNEKIHTNNNEEN